MTRMMIMAGGTGGHVMPALAVARQLRERGAEVRWMGNADGLESTLATADGFELDAIHIRGLRQSGLARKLAMPWMLAQACARSLRIFRERKPEVLLGMGGFVSGPGGLVAGILRKPLVLHEQNAVAGLTNRWLARLATRVLTGFPDTEGLSMGQWVGNPVRRDIADLPAPRERLAERDGFLRLLVVGGSQGARVFNEELPGLLATRFTGRIEVLHQCGRNNAEPVISAYADRGIDARVQDFIEDMAAAYAWCDVVVCRAGAMTVAEVCAAGAVAIFVPYPFAVNDHQARNADYLARQDAAFSVPQPAFIDGDWLGRLDVLARDRGKLLEMAEKSRALAKPDAAKTVADICEALAHA